MALRNQPYIPLYVQDFQTDEKLIECSAQTTGVYIRLLCIMHKSDEYGTFLLKQKDKHLLPTCLDFATSLVKYMPYTVDVIESSISELLFHKVLQQNGAKLLQKRMIKDNDISIKRASAGSKGGKKTQFAKAKNQANSENEYETEYEFETIKDIISSELPTLKLDGIVSSQSFSLIDNFIQNNPAFSKTEQWKDYIDKIKASDFIMKEKGGGVSLSFVCNDKTLLDIYGSEKYVTKGKLPDDWKPAF